jgi:hypothetical protein
MMLLQAAGAQAGVPAGAAPAWISLDTSMSGDVLGAWIVCFLTLAVYSFLYRDNPFYKVAEHLFVGLGAAWYTLENYEGGVLGPVREYLHQTWAKIGQVDPATGRPVLVELGGYPVQPEWAIALRCVALVFALMLLVRLFSRNHWAPRWPLAAMVGIYAAIKMTGETQSKLVLQIKETMTPLVSEAAVPWSEFMASDTLRIEQSVPFSIFANLVFVIGLVCVLSHFIFTYRRTKVLAGMSRVGIVTLMLTFGSMFGFTVLGRIALLIDRVADLKSYSAPAYSLAGTPAPGVEPGLLSALLSPPFLVGALMLALLALWGASQRRKPALQS